MNMGGKDITNNCIYSRSSLNTVIVSIGYFWYFLFVTKEREKKKWNESLSQKITQKLHWLWPHGLVSSRTKLHMVSQEILTPKISFQWHAHINHNTEFLMTHRHKKKREREREESEKKQQCHILNHLLRTMCTYTCLLSLLFDFEIDNMNIVLIMILRHRKENFCLKEKITFSKSSYSFTYQSYFTIS